MKRFGMVALGVPAMLLVVFGAQAFGPDPKPAYITAPVERGDVVSFVSTTGTLKPVGEVKVGSQVSGQIAELLADFNDRLKKGQPLAKLDEAILAARVRGASAAVDVARSNVEIKRAAILKARAELVRARDQETILQANAASTRAGHDEAKRALDRKKDLFDNQAISRAGLEEAIAAEATAAADLNAKKLQRRAQVSSVQAAESVVKIAEAELANAEALVRERQAQLDQTEIEIDRMTIKSPIDGVVIGRDVERGQTVAATLEAPTLFTLAEDLRKMEVHAKIDEADIGRIKVGQQAVFTVDAFPDRTFSGTVEQIRKSPEVVQNVVVYTVAITAGNPDELLLPGMTAFVRIVVSKVGDAVKVPNAALRFRPEGVSERPGPPKAMPADDGNREGSPAVIWVLGENSTPEHVTVRTGATDGAATQVLSGPLAAGQQVIVGVGTSEKPRRNFLGFTLGG